MAKVVQVSMDGPNVNWPFYDELCTEDVEARLQLPAVGCWVVRPPHC